MPDSQPTVLIHLELMPDEANALEDLLTDRVLTEAEQSLIQKLAHAPTSVDPRRYAVALAQQAVSIAGKKALYDHGKSA